MLSGRLRFRILGPLAAFADGEPLPVSGPKQRALLALLLLSANRVVPRDRLLAELFVELSPASADHALRNQMSRLRKTLAAAGADTARVVTRPPGYLLRVEPGELDLDEFERLVSDGREALAAGDPTSAAGSLRAADALWSGRALADLDLEGLLRIEIERLEELRLAAVEERIEAELALGRQRELVGELQALSSEHPYRERFRAQLMLALYRSGRQAEGLEVYQRTRTLFDDELGLVPGVELQELERAILLQDPALRAPTGDGAEPNRLIREAQVCPFKGLAPFESEDAERFFGRERLVDELLARLDESPLLLLTGPSGTGKSSLLRAGLLPPLEGRKIVIRPGMRPAAELARAVGADLAEALDRLPPGERVVIAVDQLEEVFAAGVDEDERAAFFATLVEAGWDPGRRALILLALRGDFADRLALYPELSDLVAPNQASVGPMSASELRRAIEGPADRAGLEVEPALVDALVHDVVGEPGGLPLLSAALVDLWRERRDSSLTLEAYEESGGIQGAVARHAEAALNSLRDDEQSTARRIALQLVSGGDGEPLTRRRVSRADLGAGDDQAGVLSALVERRLLVADTESIELVHDALLQQWPRLKEWLSEEAEDRRLRRHLGQAASAWAAADRDRSDLYRGARLAAVSEWAAGPDTSLQPLERDFLEESQRAFVSETDRQRRTARRLRSLLVVAVVLLAAVAAVGGIAFVERASAQQHATVADAERLGAQALVESSPDTSLLLAREGVNLDNSPATRSNLLAALLRFPAVIGVASNHGSRILDDAISPNGGTLAYRTDNGNVAFLNARTLQRDGQPFTDPSGSQLADYGDIAPFPDHALAFSPDGHTLAVGSSNGNNAEVYLVDTSTHRQRPAAYDSIRPATVDLLYAPTGRTLVAGEITSGRTPPRPAEVIVNLNPVNLRPRRSSAPLPDGRLVGFLDHGRELLVTTGARSSVLLNARTLHRVRTLRGLGGAAAVSTKRDLAAFGHNDGSVTLLDLRTGATTPLRGHSSAPITSLAFNPDGTTIASTAADGSVDTWDVATTSLQQTFTGHAAAAEGPVFSPDGATLYAGGDDGSLIAWDVRGTRRLGRAFRFAPAARTGEGPQPQESLGVPPPTAVSPDGSLFATSPKPGRVTLWHARDDAVVGEVSGPTGTINAIAFSHHGHLLAAAGTGARIAIWNLTKPKVVRLLQRPFGSSGARVAIAFSPDDCLLAEAGGDNSIGEYDLRTGRFTNLTYSEGALQTQALDFSSDGRFLAAAGLGGQITVVDLRHDTNITPVLGSGTDDIYALRFSPEGDTLATGDRHGDVDFWNAATGKRLPRRLVGPGGSITSLSFDPGGGRLMTISNDDGIRLWDLTTDKPIGTPLPGGTSGGGFGAFLPTGDQIVAVFETGAGVLWNVDPASWSAQACRIANRNLTRAEWRTYLSNRPYAKTCP